MKRESVSAIKVLFASLIAVGFYYGSSCTATVFAQSQRPVNIRIASSTAGLDFAPLWVAQRKGYFRNEGIEFEPVLITGGAATMAALINGDVQFTANSASDVLLLRARGDQITALGAFPVSLDWNIAARNEWLKSKGLTKDKVKKMTVQEKVRAMKGAIIGAATVGGAPAQVARYICRQYGLKPDEDVRQAVEKLSEVKAATFMAGVEPEADDGAAAPQVRKTILKVEARQQANNALVQVIQLFNERNVPILSVETLEPNLETVCGSPQICGRGTVS